MWHALAVFRNIASAAAAQTVSSHHKARSAPCRTHVSRMWHIQCAIMLGLEQSSELSPLVELVQSLFADYCIPFAAIHSETQ